MAWIKIIENESGVSEGYWDIEKVFFNALTGQAEVSWCGWISKEAKLAGKAPVSSRNMIMDASGNPELLATALGVMQTAIMARPEFAGATLDE